MSGTDDLTATLVAGRHLAPPDRPGLLARSDPYELLRLLGSGSTGIVYQARDTRTGSVVALKLLKPGLIQEPRVVQRFLLEAGHLQKLIHPNLVRVLEVIQRPEIACFAMPYYAAGSLARTLRRGSPLPSDRALRIAADVAEALLHIHRKGLIHRDVKPGNILLADGHPAAVPADLPTSPPAASPAETPSTTETVGRAPPGGAVLADFGLVRTLFHDPTLDVERAAYEGTAPYMSPAIVAGEVEDTRCDIYALGAVLYEMLAGRPPYEGATPADVRQRILAGPPPRATQANPSAHPELAQVAEWAMAREHRDRYANVADLLRDLRRIEHGQPPLGPHRHSLDWRTWLSHHSKRVTRASIALGVVLLAGLVTALWPKPALYRVKSYSHPQVPLWDLAVPADFDGDGAAELLVVSNNRLLVFSAWEGRLVGRRFEAVDASDAALEGADDVNGDGMADAWVSWSTAETNIHLSLLSHLPQPYKKFSTFGRPQDQPDRRTTSRLGPRPILRDAQGVPQRVLASIRTGWGGQPRGLYCFNYATAKLLWAYLTGPMVESVQLEDLNGDGQADILFGTESLGNDSVAPDGSDDEHAYLYALTTEGNLLWRRTLSDVNTSAHQLVLDLDGDGRREAVAWIRSLPDHQTTNRWDVGLAYAFDFQGRELARYQAKASFSHTGLAIDGNGRQELLLIDFAGDLHVLGPNLSLVRKVNVVPLQHSLVEARLIGTARLRRQEPPYVVIRSSQPQYYAKQQNPEGDPTRPFDHHDLFDCRVLVLNSRAEPIASFLVAPRAALSFQWQVCVADADGDGLDEILVLTDRVDILKLK